MRNEVRCKRKRDALGTATHQGRMNKDNVPSLMC